MSLKPVILLERELCRELKRSRRQLVRNAGKRLAEGGVGRQSGSIPKHAVVAHKVGVVENIEGFRAKIQLHALAPKRERPFCKWRDLVNRSTSPGIASNYYSVDHGTIRCCAGIAEIVRAGRNVERQSRGQSAYSADRDVQRRDIESAEDEAMALVENGVAVLGRADKIRIIRILLGNVGIHVVAGMRVHIAGQHGEPAGEAVVEVQVEGLVVRVAVIYVVLDDGIGRLWTGGFRWIAR